MAPATGAEAPEIALVVGELGDLLGDEDGDAVREEALDLLDEIGRCGPTHGVRLLAATRRPEAVDDALLARFGTRFVLEVPDEAQSLRLLGRPDATDLGGGGELFLRVAGRLPVHARGFRVPPDRLARLARLAHQAYGGPEAPLPTRAVAGDRSWAQPVDDGLASGFADAPNTPSADRLPEALVAERRAWPEPAWQFAGAQAEAPGPLVTGGSAGGARQGAHATVPEAAPVAVPAHAGRPAPAPPRRRCSSAAPRSVHRDGSGRSLA